MMRRRWILLTLILWAGSCHQDTKALFRLFLNEDFIHARLGLETRQAFFLKSPVKQVVLAPKKAKLCFCGGALFNKSSPSQELKIKVTIEKEGAKPITRHLRFGKTGWKDQALDLSRFSGAKVQIRFEPHGIDSKNHLFLSNVRLYPNPRIKERPNLIFFAIDTLRADHLGCYGYERDTSPFMDGLAKDGVLFENAYSQTSWTLPSFMSIFTGLYPSNHRVTAPKKKLKKQARTLPKFLQSQGYVTLGMHGGGYMGNAYGFCEGFDLYWKTRGLKDLLKENNPISKWLQTEVEGPFFLFIHTFDTHAPYGKAPEKYNRLFTDPAFEDPFDLKTCLPYDQNKKHPLGEKEIKYLIDLYDGSIRLADDCLGEFFEFLKRTGRLENTHIALFSDHGEEFNEHGSFEHHQTLHEESVRIPLILWGSGLSKGVRVKPLVESVDLAPTMLQLLGFDPWNVDGQALGFYGCPDFQAPTQKKNFAVGQFYDGCQAIRFKEWACILNQDGDTQLYHRIDDLQEQNNQAPAKKDLTRRFSKIYDLVIKNSRTRSLSDAEPVHLSEKEKAQLKALGY